MKRERAKTSMTMKKRIILLLLLFCIPSLSKGTGTFNADSLQEREIPTTKRENIFHRTVNFIERLLEQDTFYVEPNRYNLSVMPQYTYGYEYYRFSAQNKEQNIVISPSSNNKLGVSFGWRWIFVGYSFALNNVQPEIDMDLNLYCSRAGIELFYRKRSDGFKIRSLKGFYENDIPMRNYNKEFNGLSTSQVGANVFYIFNSKKFSFPAAYSQSTNQRKSAGSLILGLSYNEQLFMFDHTTIDSKIESQMLPELKFKKIDYMDLSINFGYSYNWVFAKNFLANISSSPAIGYKSTSLKSLISSNTEFISSINFDLVSRLALVYNNGRYYAGASFVSHTYSYSNPSLSIINGFGYLKIYAGFNFWRRK